MPRGTRSRRGGEGGRSGDRPFAVSPYFTSSISNGIPANWLFAVSLLPLMLPVDRRGLDLAEWNVMAAPAASYVP
jgi:hypothetical protein